MNFVRSGIVVLFLLAALPGLAQQEAAEKLLAQGTQLQQQKKYEDAYKTFEKANKVLGEKCSICLLRMSITRMYLNDERGAMKFSNKALEISPDAQARADANGVRGEVLMYFAGDDKKKLAQAEEIFRAAAKDEPSTPVFHMRIGMALIRQGKDEEGKKELQAYLDRDPNGRDADKVHLWMADPRRLRFTFAPGFAVTTLKGETFTLSQLAGKVVLLDFWGTWCPPCRASIPELQEMFKKYPPDKLVIVSVSSDTDEQKWKQFVVDHEMEWHQYIDLDRHVQIAFNVHEFPTYVLIDKDGIIRERVSGLNPQETLAGRMKEPLKKVFTAEAAAR